MSKSDQLKELASIIELADWQNCQPIKARGINAYHDQLGTEGVLGQLEEQEANARLMEQQQKKN